MTTSECVAASWIRRSRRLPRRNMRCCSSAPRSRRGRSRLAPASCSWTRACATTCPGVRSRGVHVVSETARTRFAAQLLEEGRLRQFGALLYESHESCRRLYECSTPELDTIVAAAKRAGALGARLTGAGWGGAAIVLTKERGAGSGEQVIDAVRNAFQRAHGREPAISGVSASGGARSERV